MAYNYDITHEKIINNGKKLFLEKGYEKTNLRQICLASGVTNGAFYRHFESKEHLFSILVEDCIKGFRLMYTNTENDCFELLSKKEILSALEISSETIITFIDYIYKNFEEFKLLLLCSSGTKYEQFIEDIVDLEVSESIKFFKQVENLNIKISIPSKRTIHMLSHCYFNTIFECVVHDLKKEEALSEVSTLVDFFKAGWRKILGI